MKKILLNNRISFIIIIIFSIWMIFFDSNSLTNHINLNKKILQLEIDKKYYIEQINKDSITLENLKTESGIEKFAREKYFMKKKNEEIFIIDNK